MSPAAISFLVLGAVIVLFVWNRLPAEIVALGGALVLYATGVLDLHQILAGFGDPVVVFIAALFVVSEGLDATGVTAWAGQQLIARTGPSPGRQLVLVMLLAGVLTALISGTGAVAALLPMVVLLAVRLGRSPSGLVMPLAFAAHAGSLLALSGSPVNVIVSDAAADAGGGSFGFLEYALVGVPLLAGTIAIAALLGRRVLPDRTPRTIPADLSEHARTLVKQYRLDDGAFRLQVRPDSTCLDAPADALELSTHLGLTVVGVQAHGRGGRLAAGDVLIIRGDHSAVADVAKANRLRLLPEAGSDHVAGALLDRELGVAEIVVAPRSKLVGQGVFPGMVTSSGDLVILAVQRKGDDLGPRQTVLAPGDTLLLQGTWQALDRTVDDVSGVLFVDRPAAVRRQAAPLGTGAARAIAVLAGMVVLLATGVVPPAVAALLAAGAMILLRVLTVSHAYRGIRWPTVVLVAAMIPLSTAIQQSGAAGTLAGGLVAVVGDHGPHALLLGVFLLTAVLGQMISNMATALIVIPIAVTAAAELGVSARPVLMCVAVAAAASFLTPVATPANMMVTGPGGYRFGDYWRLGLPVLAWFLVVAVLLVPVFWPF